MLRLRTIRTCHIDLVIDQVCVSFISTVLEDLQIVKKCQNRNKGISNSIYFILFCFVVIWNEKCLNGLKFFKNKQLNAHIDAYVSLK